MFLVVDIDFLIVNFWNTTFQKMPNFWPLISKSVKAESSKFFPRIDSVEKNLTLSLPLWYDMYDSLLFRAFTVHSQLNKGRRSESHIARSY